MTVEPFHVKLWGVRGSLPVSGPDFREFGGNTICIEMRCGDHVLMFDAGSGIAQAGAALCAEGRGDINLFFTHCHYDHIIGLPFFAPLYRRDTALNVWSGHMAGRMTTADMIAEFMRRPFFPIGPEKYTGRVAPHDFQPGDTLSPCSGVTIRTGLLPHPGNAVGYRVEWAGRSVAVITDVEHEPGTLDPVVMRLIAGADLFLYDASFADETFHHYRGYGHSTWQQAVRLAEASGARRVGLIHHAEGRTDAQLRAVDKAAQARFSGAFCGRDGQVIEV